MLSEVADVDRLGCVRVCVETFWPDGFPSLRVSCLQSINGCKGKLLEFGSTQKGLELLNK